MRRKSALIEVKVGKLVVFRARCHAVGNQTVVDASVPKESWIKTEVCALLAMAAVELAPNTTARIVLRQCMSECGHDTDGEPISLTQEQFSALLGGTAPSVPDDLPF